MKTKKLHLDLASLRVESFDAAAEAPARGTVAGNALTEQSCPNLFTCANTCDPDDFSCNGQNTCYGGACPDTYYLTCIPNCTGGQAC